MSASVPPSMNSIASLTIQATDLVNMAYLKLHSSGQGMKADVDPQILIEQLDELEAMGEQRQSAMVIARVFFKLSNAEIAAQLDVSVKTVEEDLRKARAWLKGRHTD